MTPGHQRRFLLCNAGRPMHSRRSWKTDRDPFAFMAAHPDQELFMAPLDMSPEDVRLGGEHGGVSARDVELQRERGVLGGGGACARARSRGAQCSPRHACVQVACMHGFMARVWPSGARLAPAPRLALAERRDSVPACLARCMQYAVMYRMCLGGGQPPPALEGLGSHYVSLDYVGGRTKTVVGLLQRVQAVLDSECLGRRRPAGCMHGWMDGGEGGCPAAAALECRGW